ncbi:MAG: hypothetical protein QOJ64_3558 [Acidobacteriota bacterium]|jgi:hypothetical protein|nr:hypothetical protein [Acidobacteriota bacterium]
MISCSTIDTSHVDDPLPTPGEPDAPSDAPSDPIIPDPSQPEPLPLPPDTPAPAPIREPSDPQPAGDPASREPMRMVGLQ